MHGCVAPPQHVPVALPKASSLSTRPSRRALARCHKCVVAILRSAHRTSLGQRVHEQSKIWIDLFTNPRSGTVGQAMKGGESNHGGVIGAQGRFGGAEREPGT